ncbi:cytoplasmic protein [Coprinopsis marcescibilis]|uniref:Cytoplasmic protein n=1 Tax=Coprinopsis marcescibilis TaxID=230819 RepID=A0A5C3L5L8_COPMA|nr:cytoplasmic protein [Coprinopsis marcescibilis]
MSSATATTLDVFPEQTPSYILSFQFSSWYPKFSDVSIKSTIIKPLSDVFRKYLESESVFVPEGSDDLPVESTLSDDEEPPESDDDGEAPPSYAFPDLDAEIRASIKQYDGVFPKLNFTSPRDAAWVLAAGSPLKCTTPADVYLLLKSSDFIMHDLERATVFEGCEGDESSWSPYELELVLRKWYPINPSREVRCFVRNGKLVGISQRDTNYYDFLNVSETQDVIRSSVMRLWEEKIKPRQEQRDYVFDLLLTRDLSRGHVVDFNPYAPKTDSLLFSYKDLCDLAVADNATEFRVIDSPAHPLAIRNAPVHQHNAVPMEAIQLSSGRSIDEFAELWKAQLNESTEDA